MAIANNSILRVISSGGISVDGLFILYDSPTADLGKNGDYAIDISRYGKQDLGTIIPAQNDDTNCTASNTKVTDGDWFPHYAFDENFNTAWSANNYVYPAWICYDFGETNKQKITCLSIYPRTYGQNTQMKDFEFQASNDGTTWDTLIPRETIPNKGVEQWFSYKFQNQNFYRYYRLYVHTTNGQTITIKEVHLNTQGQITDYGYYLSIYHKENGTWILKDQYF